MYDHTCVICIALLRELEETPPHPAYRTPHARLTAVLKLNFPAFRTSITSPVEARAEPGGALSGLQRRRRRRRLTDTPPEEQPAVEQAADRLDQQAEQDQQQADQQQADQQDQQQQEQERPPAQLSDSLLMVQVENVTHDKFDHTEEVKVRRPTRADTRGCLAFL